MLHDNETGFWAQVRTGGLGAVKVNVMTAAPTGFDGPEG
jgi:hypothetical protein